MRRIALNLTPLLDVILLMVFAYQIQSLQMVSASEQLKERADRDMLQLQERREAVEAENRALKAEMADLRSEAAANRQPSALAETLDELAGIDAGSLEQALAHATEEEREQIRQFTERMAGREAAEVWREIAKLESYNKYVSSWFLQLAAEHEYGLGISQIWIVVDDAEPRVGNFGPSRAELENGLEKLLRDELAAELDKSQRLVIVNVSHRCGLFKRHKDDFLAVLRHQVFPGLGNDRALENTQFLFGREEASCRNAQ